MNLKKMEDTLMDSYKGFYCTICDQENHKYFDLERREIIFSEKFCRDLIEGSLNSLLFFHIDIVKFANLVSKFLLSCDKKGDYEADIPIPDQVIFVEMERDVQILSKCREERNNMNWF